MNPYRLPRTAIPKRYELTLEPNLATAGFRGTVAVELDVTEAVDELMCNAIDLAVDRAWVETPTGERIDTTAVELDEGTERATFHLASFVQPGPAVLHIEFTGRLNDKLRGFYRSRFTDADGVEQVIATTQMEATDARRAFPCWDEPDLKAVFAVTLVVADGLAALSNAREIGRQRLDDGRVEVRFADTMPMSTYLVAFIVGPLDLTEPVLVDNKELRVAYPRGKGHLTDFALDVGRFCLEFFRDYYGIVYPGDKLDLVAVPDFAFGAMENLGCVTFREALLLVDPSEVTQPELQRVTDVIAHELAHMWFGDLVTMKWWNGIWLNEAFATFMEMLATDAYRPEWQRWVGFGLSRTAAFDVDALASTRPIEFEVVSPADAEGMFDILTYEKGAAVVRMLEQYLEADNFRDGIRHYLSRHQYANTETTDLWDAIEAATGEPVRRIMDSWILQGGFPLIEVALEHDDLHGPESGVLRISQRHFAYLDEAVTDRQWVVPLLVTTSERPAPGAEPVVTLERVLLEGDELRIPLPEQLDWVLVNAESTGFYRVAYSRELAEALVRHAQTQLSPTERYALVDDTWARVAAGQASTDDFLDLAQGLADETDLSVWERIIAGLSFCDRLVHLDHRAAFCAAVRDLVAPALDRLGLEPRDGDTDRDRQLRGALLDALAVLGDDQDAQATARALHDRVAAGEAVDPSLAAAAVRVIAATGTRAEFDDFMDRFSSATSPQVELRYLYALADFPDAPEIDRLLAMCLDSTVRTQNAPYVLRLAMTNRQQGPRAWACVRDRWDEINARFPTNTIARMLEGVRSLHQREVADDVFAFFEAHEVPQGDKILAQHLERLEVNVALRARETPVLARRFS